MLHYIYYIPITVSKNNINDTITIKGTKKILITKVRILLYIRYSVRSFCTARQN